MRRTSMIFWTPFRRWKWRWRDTVHKHFHTQSTLQYRCVGLFGNLSGSEHGADTCIALDIVNPLTARNIRAKHAAQAWVGLTRREECEMILLGEGACSILRLMS